MGYLKMKIEYFLDSQISVDDTMDLDKDIMCVHYSEESIDTKAEMPDIEGESLFRQLIHYQTANVQVWLEKLFGDKSVPAYELNEFTVGTLHALARKNVQAERDHQLIVEDLRQKAEEYNAESRRLEGILKYLNLTPGSLSQSGLISLKTLIDLALILKTKDATDTSFILAFQQLESEMRKVEEARRSEEKILRDLMDRIKTAVLKHGALSKARRLEEKILRDLMDRMKTAVLKHGALSKALEDLELKSEQEHAQIKSNARETQFIRTKAKEYKSQVTKFETHLQKLGVDQSIYHRSLVERAEELDSLKQEIIPMKKKLDSYHGLPPDAFKAHMKLDELRDKVAKLEEVLSSKIDVMLLK